MRGFGGTLILFGAGSFILNLLGMEFILLVWVDLWGTLIGNIIRVVMIVAGIGLLMLSPADEVSD